MHSGEGHSPVHPRAKSFFNSPVRNPLEAGGKQVGSILATCYRRGGNGLSPRPVSASPAAPKRVDKPVSTRCFFGEKPVNNYPVMLKASGKYAPTSGKWQTKQLLYNQ